MRRRLAFVAIAALLLLVAPVGRGASGDTSSLFGWDLSAVANAASLLYDQPSFGLPAKPTLEFHASHADTHLDSGPSGHALGSVLWPGDVVGNAPAATAFDVLLADPTKAGYLKPAIDPIRNGLDSAPIPVYPVRSETTYPPGGSPAPNDMGGGVTMSSKSVQDQSVASATYQHGGFAGAYSFGVLESSSFSGLRKGRAVAEARTHLTNIDIAGEIQIAGIDSAASTTSDGVKASTTGSVAIAGLVIHGTPVVYDATGLHAFSQTADPYGQVAAGIVKQLAPQGISISIDKPGSIVEGPTGMVSTAGIVVRLSSHAMGKLVQSVPQPYRDWIQYPATSPLQPVFDQFTNEVKGYSAAPFQFDNDVSIVLGSVTVRGAASPPFNFTLPLGPISIGPPAPPACICPMVSYGPPPKQTRVLGKRTTAPPHLRLVGVIGVPAASVLLLALFALLVAARLRRLADTITPADQEGCTLKT